MRITIKKGINDIATTHPRYVKYFLNEEESTKYSHGSTKRLFFKCPNCQHVKEMPIQRLIFQGFGCERCSDGISFGEKFIANLLTQLNIDYFPQLSKKQFDWCGKYRYDFYLVKENTIIEVHGQQHYRKSFETCGGDTLNQVVQNDEIKKKLAEDNGIDNYIIIDARKSDVSHIKNSILSSKLSDIIDAELNSVEWKDIILKTGNNLIREVCEYYNKTNKSPMEISKIFNIGKSTAINYLKFGNETGLCEYDPAKKSSENGVKYGHIQGIKNGKEVCIYKDGKLLGTFYSMTELSRVSEKLFGVKLAQTSISKAVRNKNVYHGFTFSLSDNN